MMIYKSTHTLAFRIDKMRFTGLVVRHTPRVTRQLLEGTRLSYSLESIVRTVFQSDFHLRKVHLFSHFPSHTAHKKYAFGKQNSLVRFISSLFEEES